MRRTTEPSSRRRQLARAVVKAKTLEARREAAAVLSNYIDMEEGWVPPIPNLGLDGTFKRENGAKTKTKTKSQGTKKGRNRPAGRMALGNLKNMDRISARRGLVSAARDLERRTVGRLVEDRETKAKIRSGAPLTPVGQKSAVPKTLEEYEAAGLAELLEGYASPEPILSSPTKSRSLQQVLSEMQRDAASQHWGRDMQNRENKSKNKCKPGDPAWMRAPEEAVARTVPGSASGTSGSVGANDTFSVSFISSRSFAPAADMSPGSAAATSAAISAAISATTPAATSAAATSAGRQTSLPLVPNIKIRDPDPDHHAGGTASVAGSDASSLGDGSGFDYYMQPFLRRPELLGVAHTSASDAATFAGLAPGSAFYGQFLNGGMLQNRLGDPCLCFPDTLVRLHVGGKFRWIWIEAGAQSAEEILYLDRPLAVRREHIIARICGGWNSDDHPRTRDSSVSDAAEKNETLHRHSAATRPLAVFKRSTGITSADTNVLFHREDVVERMKEIFSTNTQAGGSREDHEILSAFPHSDTSSLVLQRFVGGRVVESDSAATAPRKKNATRKLQQTPAKENWINKDDAITRLVRVRSRCGRGNATVWTISGGGDIALKMATQCEHTPAGAVSVSVPELRPCTTALYGLPSSASTAAATAGVVPGSEAGMLSMTPVHLVSAHDPMCHVLRQDSLAARQTAMGPTVSLVRSLVHLLSETYPRLLFSELTADYVPDRSNPGQFWLLQIKGFRAKGPPSALPPAEKSSEAALGAAAVALATSRSALRSAPSGRNGGSFPSLPTVRGSSAGRGSFQSAWGARSDSSGGSAARRRRKGGIAKQSMKNVSKRPATSQALRDVKLKQKRKPKKCPGDYCCSGGAKKEAQSHQVDARILFKSIAEDRVQVRPGDYLPARFRARMYDEVVVCGACFEEYSRKDAERAKALAQVQVRACAFVVASEAKYAKFQGKGTGGKLNPVKSMLIKRYEARRVEEKRAKQDMLEQGRKEKGLRKMRVQAYRKKMRQDSLEVLEKGVNSHGTSVQIAADIVGRELEKENVGCKPDDEDDRLQQQLEDDVNQCLLCGAVVTQCKCSLTPRPEVRALMSRVDTAFFS
jgi:hypothetical protein